MYDSLFQFCQYVVGAWTLLGLYLCGAGIIGAAAVGRGALARLPLSLGTIEMALLASSSQRQKIEDQIRESVWVLGATLSILVGYWSLQMIPWGLTLLVSLILLLSAVRRNRKKLREVLR